MEAIRLHEGVCAPLPVDNVDTDQIIPSREMKRVSKQGLGEGLFAGSRYLYEDMRKVGLSDDFVLNKPEYKGASILLSGRNFGCGSSREHAVWALHDFGIRAVVAESFGRIFRINCARNGLLAIELPGAQIEVLIQQTRPDPPANRVVIDLPNGQICAPLGEVFEFVIDESDRRMLMLGLDYIDYSLQYAADIDAFKKKDTTDRPWAYL
ncbi:MAG: 3-isopropylmalate dehydratase small subunit [Woeseiaceae bacterium]